MLLASTVDGCEIQKSHHLVETSFVGMYRGRIRNQGFSGGAISGFRLTGRVDGPKKVQTVSVPLKWSSQKV